MAIKQPPFVNGEMTLTDVQTKAIKEKLIVIRDAFVPSDDQLVWDTFYLTATYNRENSTFPVNGDTVQMLLTEETPIGVI